MKGLNRSAEPIQIGVGLRSAHYTDVLTSGANIDFVEVHSENFFAAGGASLALLKQVVAKYPLSFHSTAGGLGSIAGVAQSYRTALVHLVAQFEPMLISDHACFSWIDNTEGLVHAGDLLPLAFNQASLNVMSNNVTQLQNELGRTILIENIVAYLDMPDSDMSETQFLSALAQQTQCKLLIDLNNLIVNGLNTQQTSPLDHAKLWLQNIPLGLVGEFHLAGCTVVAPGELIVDDHATAVSEPVWELYRFALQRFGAIPTLIEWDTQIPAWTVLVAEADKARRIAREVFGHD